MKRPYAHLDVFADEAFSGNQLAVFIDAVGLDRDCMQRIAGEMAFAETTFVFPVFLFSLERGDDDATVFSRMFAPLFGIPEDPATGGASGPLGAYLLIKGAVTPKQAEHMLSLQGVAMGRPSRIAISVSSRNGAVSEVRVGGTCVSLGSGFLEIPENAA